MRKRDRRFKVQNIRVTVGWLRFFTGQPEPSKVQTLQNLLTNIMEVLNK
jgi:hypothetical protein